jgi:uncharacterized membrane protein YciS (DUF1049 family)
MMKYVIEKSTDYEIWQVLSLLIFVGFFIGALIVLFKMSRSYIHNMENLPLDLDDRPE